MGLPFALVRPIAALCTALFGGCMANIFSKKEIETPIQNIEEQSDKEEKQNFIQKIISAFRYGFVDMMQDIGRWLVLGLIIAGLITVFVPESFFALFAHNSLLSMLIVLLFAIPMYLCATGSIPIAVALMLKGLSPGTALVLLMAGPAANMASILVINKVLGKRNLIIYLFSIISGAILFGLGIDYLLPREWFTTGLSVIQESCHNHTNGWSEYIWTIILSILLINALLLRYCKKEKHCHCNSCETTKQKEDNMTITIQGMNCNHCKNSAEKALLSVEGVEKVEIDLASGTTIITGKATIEDVKNAIYSIGFTIKE
jgi:copper chaperone CopZ